LAATFSSARFGGIANSWHGQFATTGKGPPSGPSNARLPCSRAERLLTEYAAPLPVNDALPTFALNGIDSVAHIIQVALTPVFLLSGIGTLLNMFNTRLSRVSDHTWHMFELLGDAEDEAKRAHLIAHMARLQQRRLALDVAVIMGAVGGASTCGAALVLFLGGLREAQVASWLFVLFGLALGCVVCSLVAFVADTLLAWHGLHREGPMPPPKSE
jgi:hypothetical protein